MSMNSIKTTVRWGGGLQRAFNMPLHFQLLTVMASMSCFILGQTYHSEIRWQEERDKDKESSWSKMAQHIVEGTRRQGQPWEISQRRVRQECKRGTCASCNEVGEMESLRSSSSWSWAEARVPRLIRDCSRERMLCESASAT